MAQPSGPPYDANEEATPAERLVRLLEEQGLEDSLRAILDAIEARRASADEQYHARLELLEWLLEGQAPLTEEELEQARREWQE